MFLFFECYQSENILILFLFNIKNCDLLMAKITPNVSTFLLIVYLDKTSDYITEDDFEGVQVIFFFVSKFLKEKQITVIFIFVFNFLASKCS